MRDEIIQKIVNSLRSQMKALQHIASNLRHDQRLLENEMDVDSRKELETLLYKERKAKNEIADAVQKVSRSACWSLSSVEIIAEYFEEFPPRSWRVVLKEQPNVSPRSYHFPASETATIYDVLPQEVQDGLDAHGVEREDIKYIAIVDRATRIDEILNFMGENPL